MKRFNERVKLENWETLLCCDDLVDGDHEIKVSINGKDITRFITGIIVIKQMGFGYLE